MSVDVKDPSAPPINTQTFGGLVKVAKGQSTTLLVASGLTFKGWCLESPEDPAQNLAKVTIATNEDGTQYSAMNLYGGGIATINVADGDVEVMSYDAGCGMVNGPFFQGGIAFSVAKPATNRAFQGVMACGVATLGADAVFSGYVIW